MKRTRLILVIVLAGMLVMLLSKRCQILFSSPDTNGKDTNPRPLDMRDGASGVAEAPKSISLAAAFSAPIVFYGKVQAQDGLPVASAEIHAEVANKFGGESSKIHAQSDQHGLFKIVSRGLTLSVRVSKEGYFSFPERDGNAQRSAEAFDYGADIGSGIHKPKEQMPEVFILYKPGALEPLSLVREKEIPMPRNGEAVSVPLDTPSRQLILKCSSSEWQKEIDGRYDWKLEVSVVSGELQRHNDDFTFIAPSESYQQNDTIQMPRTLARPEWHDDFEQSYWLRFNDGVFGTVKVRMIAGGAHYAMVKGHINPKQGSRNLETDPSKHR